MYFNFQCHIQSVDIKRGMKIINKVSKHQFEELLFTGDVKISRNRP